MMLDGDRDRQSHQLGVIIDAYEQFFPLTWRR